MVVNKQKGSIVVIVLVLIVLAAIGQIAYWVYHKQHSRMIQSTTKTTLNSPSKLPTTTAPAKPTITQPASPISHTQVTPTQTTPPTPKPTNQNTITIGPLGIQIIVPDAIKDLTYSIATNSSGVTIVSFSTQAISNAVPQCAATINTGAFDTVQKGNGQYPGPTNPASGALIKQYVSYYLSYELPTGPCAHNLTPDQQSLLDAAAQDFSSSLSTIQATQ